MLASLSRFYNWHSSFELVFYFPFAPLNNKQEKMEQLASDENYKKLVKQSKWKVQISLLHKGVQWHSYTQLKEIMGHYETLQLALC